MNWRTGIGYDVHRLAPDRPLVLGGVTVPHDRGLTGWSDADVLTHAVMDALLGAAGLGDIGVHFPPGDPRFKGISSLKLLEQTGIMLSAGGWRPVNIDAVIAAEQPRLRDHIADMCLNLAGALGIDSSAVNVKASTTEELGFVGREEGMAAWASALIEKITP